MKILKLDEVSITTEKGQITKIKITPLQTLVATNVAVDSLIAQQS